MKERLMRDIAIEEVLQIEIKSTLPHKNKPDVQWCALSYE